MVYSDDKEPMFSIITAVYNNKDLVKNAIKSVINQSFKNFEYIIIDDGSTDETAEVLDDIAAIDERIDVIHQENKWIYESFNTGIRKAKGQYIFIVNSDDVLKDGVLYNAKTIIEKYEPDVIYGQIIEILCDKNQVEIKSDINGNSKLLLHSRFISNQREFREAWISLVKNRYVSDNINFYKRSIVKKHPYRNDTYMGDRFFNFDIAEDINTAYIIGDDTIYKHYIYEDEKNASKKYYAYSHRDGNDIYKRLMDMAKRWGIDTYENCKYIANRRMQDLTYEYRLLNASGCPFSVNEKIKYIINTSIDEIVIEAEEILGDREGFEARLLSAVRELVISDAPKENEEMYFVYELLESLLRYEKDEEDINKIYSAIYNKNNPEKIGLTFYKKIIKGNNQREKI